MCVHVAFVFVCMLLQNLRDSLKTSDEKLRKQFVVYIGWIASLNTLISNMEG